MPLGLCRILTLMLWHQSVGFCLQHWWVINVVNRLLGPIGQARKLGQKHKDSALRTGCVTTCSVGYMAWVICTKNLKVQSFSVCFMGLSCSPTVAGSALKQCKHSGVDTYLFCTSQVFGKGCFKIAAPIWSWATKRLS